MTFIKRFFLLPSRRGSGGLDQGETSWWKQSTQLAATSVSISAVYKYCMFCDDKLTTESTKAVDSVAQDPLIRCLGGASPRISARLVL